MESIKHQINRHFCASWSNIYSRFPLGKFSASAALSPHVEAQVRSPCMMLPQMMDDMTYCLFKVVDKCIFNIKKQKSSVMPYGARCFWSSHGWLAFVDPHDSGLYLLNPFTPSSTDVIRSPSIETLPCVRRVMRNDDGLIKHFELRFVENVDNFCCCTPEELSGYILHQLAFSSPPSPDNNDCIVMAVQGGSTRYDLAYCKLGDTEWTGLIGPLHPYISVTYSIKDQAFYAMGITRRLEAWDFRDLYSIKRIPIGNDNPSTFRGLEKALRNECCWFHYLLESSGDLFFVQRYYKDGNNNFPFHTYRFDVYKLDSTLGKWNCVKCLGDRALFLGLSNSFFVCAHDFPGLSPNSIYFADDINNHKEYSYGTHGLGVSDLKHKKGIRHDS